LAVSPRSPLAHYAKGKVLLAQKRYAEAIPDFSASLRHVEPGIANGGQVSR